MIEIHNIEELMKENYPPEVIEKLLMDVLVLSMKVKDDYPDYRTWYQTIQIPGIYNGTRNIIIAHIKERIVGFISLKKTSEEKKICTFYVEKNFRRNKIGMLLAAKAVEYLEEDKPLITIPLDKLNEFAHIAAKYDWQISDIKENLYRLNNPEVIVNGELKQENLSLEKRKSLKKTYKLYKFIRLKTILSTKFVERKNKIQLG